MELTIVILIKRRVLPMNEKDMALHIKALTKVIEKQTDYAEQLIRRFYNMEREISILHRRLARIEGIKDE